MKLAQIDKREIELSYFYTEAWPRLEPGPCPYIHNRSL